MDILGLVLLLLVGLLVFWGAMTLYALITLLHPPRRSYGWAVAKNQPGDPSELPRPLAYESSVVRIGGRGLAVWAVAGEDPNGPVVVVSHGWGDSRVIALQRLPLFSAHASRVVLWDMPGHGDSEGRCWLALREADDLVAVVEALRDSNEARPVVLYGWSMGAGCSIEAAARERIAGLAGVIAEAPYRHAITPARNVLRIAALPYRATLPPALAIIGLLRGWSPLWWSTGRAGRRFDRAEHARNVRVPLLVLHGDRDLICPVGDGRAIAEAAPEGTLRVVAGGAHDDLWTDGRLREAAAVEVVGFLRSVHERGGATNDPHARVGG